MTTKSRIVKSDLIESWVDLKQIVRISEAKFIDRMGFGGLFVGFEIEFRTAPPAHLGSTSEHTYRYERRLEFDEEKSFWGQRQEVVSLEYPLANALSTNVVMTDGKCIDYCHPELKKHLPKLLCLQRLNKEIQEQLLDPWKKLIGSTRGNK